MEIDREHIVQVAAEFVAENEELLEDPFIPVHILEQILLQGSEIAVVLGKETEKRTNATADKARETEWAYRGKASPKRIYALEREHTALHAEHEAYHGPFMDFVDFMERVRSVYYNAADIEDEDPEIKETAAGLEGVDRLADDPEAAATKATIAGSDVKEIRRSDEATPRWWRRLFNLTE